MSCHCLLKDRIGWRRISEKEMKSSQEAMSKSRVLFVAARIQSPLFIVGVRTTVAVEEHIGRYLQIKEKRSSRDVVTNCPPEIVDIVLFIPLCLFRNFPKHGRYMTSRVWRGFVHQLVFLNI